MKAKSRKAVGSKLFYTVLKYTDERIKAYAWKIHTQGKVYSANWQVELIRYHTPQKRARYGVH